MLLQSWSPSPGVVDSEVIRVFPAVPKAWAEASFDDLRAEGGHRVSARRENGATTWVRVTAGRDATVRIRDPFAGRRVGWALVEPAAGRSALAVARVGGNYEATLKKGDVLEGSLNAVIRR